VLLRRRVSLKSSAYVLAVVLSASLLLSMWLFEGHLAWVKVAWGFGTRHWDNMMTGTGSNLASLLQERFGWRNPHEPAVGWITIKQLLFGLYGLTLVLSCIGMAVHYRRKDRRFLIAVVVPWVLFFALCPKLHERYLVYAAAAGSLFAAVGAGVTLLNVVISLISWIMTIHVMFVLNGVRAWGFGADISPTFGQSLSRAVGATFPGIGWAVILCALLLLYLSLTPSPRRTPRKRSRPDDSHMGKEVVATGVFE
jgi:hypothetical protein